jgi:hypothetical protein
MLRPTRNIVCAALACGVGGCGERPRDSAVVADSVVLPVEVGGCYDIVVERMPDLDFYFTDGHAAAVPPRIRLDSLPVDHWWGADYRQIGVLPEVRPGLLPLSGWQHLGTDSILLSWGTGYESVTLRLGGEPRSLRGTAETWWDYREGAVTGASAEFVDCSAPVPDSMRPVYEVQPPAVALASGDTIVVGQPPSPGIAVLDREDGLYPLVVFNAVPIGTFRDATAVSARLDSLGIVRSIGLRFEYPILVTNLRERLEPLLGPPMSADSAIGANGTVSGYVDWHDRFHGVHISFPPTDVRIW